ncbi:threonine/serine ThrE exporter family protein [Rhodococcus sp. SGAir0479]|uniref:threonine/serine ThrE exporter family protein n=1 Tax=Rhodococcus sp. SGAir0479 TaxID=2567884 RepID=UPI0010CCEC98|nr:threonine/serine exporter family protein [Rhodococcus sp. SGAir0479]QCQ93714.1 threonine/serine exporter family protein [Rhodococcus sp. SGAir0479]
MRKFAASIGSLVKDRRATVDTVTAAPTPLQPIDLTDDARVAEVLDLAVRIGDLLLASGTSAMDTATQVRFVAATYGLAQCDVDVTYNSIVVSAHRGPLIPPASTMRIVHYRSMDFTRLAAADRLTRRIRLDAITPAEAHAALDAIVRAPHPYNRWVATLGWAGLAGTVAVLLGGGPLVTIVAFLTTVVIDRVNRVLNRFGLPYFFQQMTGGLIAATPATALYTIQDHLGVVIKPSQIIAAGVVVLLSGLSLVGSVQDAITGAPITASARFFEVVMMTGGIIAGVALSLRVATALGADLPVISNAAQPDLTQLPVKVVAGALASVFYALACYAERRALTAASLGGAAGLLFFVLAQSAGIGPVISSAIAATVIGFAGGLMARRSLTPPLVVAVAGITPLLPGLSLYRGLYAMLNDEVILGLTALLGAFGIGCALAAGVTLGEWGARTLRRPPRMRRTPGMRRNTTLRRPRFGRRSVVMSNSMSDAPPKVG